MARAPLPSHPPTKNQTNLPRPELAGMDQCPLFIHGPQKHNSSGALGPRNQIIGCLINGALLFNQLPQTPSKPFCPLDPIFLGDRNEREGRWPWQSPRDSCGLVMDLLTPSQRPFFHPGMSLGCVLSPEGGRKSQLGLRFMAV